MLSPARTSARINEASTSLLPLLAVGVIWYYLFARGVANQTVWLALNVIDTLRALRAVRSNGRRIGVNTRKNAMRSTLACWVIYVAGQMVGPVISTLLGWIPFYTPIKAVLCLGFIFTRVSTSSHIYAQFLVPAIKPYETPIDLTILFFQSILILVFHYMLELPIKLAWSSLKAAWTLISSIRLPSLASYTGSREVVDSHDLKPEIPLDHRMSTPPPTLLTTTSIDEDHFRYGLSPSPAIPGSILLRHPTPKPARPTLKGRRSIVFVSPPLTPKVSPPSFPEPVLEVHVPTIQAEPSTPRRERVKQEVIEIEDRPSTMLAVPQVATVRRSPRRRPQESAGVQATKVELDLDELDLLPRQAGGPALAPAGGGKGKTIPTAHMMMKKTEEGSAGQDDDEENPFVHTSANDLGRSVKKQATSKSRVSASTNTVTDEPKFPLEVGDATSSGPFHIRRPSSKTGPPTAFAKSLTVPKLETSSEPIPVAPRFTSTSSVRGVTSVAAPRPRGAKSRTPAKKRTAASTATTASMAALKSSNGEAAAVQDNRVLSDATVRSRTRTVASSATAKAKTSSSSSVDPESKSKTGVARSRAIPTATATRTRRAKDIVNTETEGANNKKDNMEAGNQGVPTIDVEEDKKVGEKRRAIQPPSASVDPAGKDEGKGKARAAKRSRRE
ncbi:hypothetical protein IAU59_001052 [Kwoniella sp. CBS 9459]